MEQHRIKAKIGVHEFEAEGEKDLVTQHYQAFLSAIKEAHSVTVPAAQPQFPISTATPSEVNAAILDRIFRQDDTLSLAALPTGDNAKADAMLAILYGYLKLRGETSVTGTSLMKSARRSGVVFDRVDRVMEANMPSFVLAAGVKKARRYQLNNPGIARAEEIIKAILQ